MKPNLTPEQRDALEQIQLNSDARKALHQLGEAILNEKYRRALIESNLEQFSDLGMRQVAHKKALLDGAFSFLRCFMGELNPPVKSKEDGE